MRTTRRHAVTMCMTHDGQSQETTDLIAYANYFFTIAFAFEMVIKLFTYKPRAYFASSWNTFDFVATWAPPSTSSSTSSTATRTSCARCAWRA